MSDQAAAKLNELMVKRGIKPTYVLVDSKIGTHEPEFLMRVTSPIVPNGPIHSADGLGRSKKEAKHQAASTFMQKYLDLANSNRSVQVGTVNTSSVCRVNVTDTNRASVLQTLCSKFHLSKPEFNEVDVTGPPHSRHFTIRCKVSNLAADGKGSTKAEAKSQATTKMIQLVMQEAQISEIFETPQLTTTPNSNEIVCLIDNLKGPQLPVKMGVFCRRNSRSSSCDSYSGSDVSAVTFHTAPKSTDTPITGIGLINNGKDVESIAESYDDSASNMSLISFDDNYQPQELANSKAKSKSMNNLTELSKFSGNDSHQRAIMKIETTLENVEKQLYNDILDTLVIRDLPHQKNVVVLSHKYEIYINHESRPKIFEGHEQCTDPSIRMACLTKLLMDLKDHAKSRGKLFNK